MSGLFYVMNNLLKTALTKESYTHIRIETLYGGHTNHIYMGVAMNDLEVHYTLDGLMEEFDYPKLAAPIQVFRQIDGILDMDEIPQYSTED